MKKTHLLIPSVVNALFGRRHLQVASFGSRLHSSFPSLVNYSGGKMDLGTRFAHRIRLLLTMDDNPPQQRRGYGAVKAICGFCVVVIFCIVLYMLRTFVYRLQLYVGNHLVYSDMMQAGVILCFFSICKLYLLVLMNKKIEIVDIDSEDESSTAEATDSSETPNQEVRESSRATHESVEQELARHREWLQRLEEQFRELSREQPGQNQGRPEQQAADVPQQVADVQPEEQVADVQPEEQVADVQPEEQVADVRQQAADVRQLVDDVRQQADVRQLVDDVRQQADVRQLVDDVLQQAADVLQQAADVQPEEQAADVQPEEQAADVRQQAADVRQQAADVQPEEQAADVQPEEQAADVRQQVTDVQPEEQAADVQPEECMHEEALAIPLPERDEMEDSAELTEKCPYQQEECVVAEDILKERECLQQQVLHEERVRQEALTVPLPEGDETDDSDELTEKCAHQQEEGALSGAVLKEQEYRQQQTLPKEAHSSQDSSQGELQRVLEKYFKEQNE